MNFTGICLIGMFVLFKVSATPERWWIALGILITAASMLGIEVGIISMAIAIGLWKVISDICQVGSRT